MSATIQNRIVLDPKRTTRTLFVVLAILVALSLFTSFCHLVLHWRLEALTILVDLDTEANLPTLFNVLLFYFGAALFFLHAREAFTQAAHGWKVMAWVFLFLGMDEGAQIHEKFVLVTKRVLETFAGDRFGGWLHYTWVIPYALAMVVLAAYLFRWFMGLSPIFQKRLIVSGIVYVFGAMFLEMAGGKLLESLPPVDPANYPWIYLGGVSNADGFSVSMHPGVIALYTLEETCEMAGLILCIRALLLELEEHRRQVTVSVAPTDETA